MKDEDYISGVDYLLSGIETEIDLAKQKSDSPVTTIILILGLLALAYVFYRIVSFGMRVKPTKFDNSRGYGVGSGVGVGGGGFGGIGGSGGGGAGGSF